MQCNTQLYYYFILFMFNSTKFYDRLALALYQPHLRTYD